MTGLSVVWMIPPPKQISPSYSTADWLRRNRPLRFVKHQLGGFIIQIAQLTRRVRHMVTRFSGITPCFRAFGQRETQIVHHKAAGIEQRMVVSFYDNQFVFRQIFSRNKSRFARTANAQTFALSDRVEHQLDVFAVGFRFGRNPFYRCRSAGISAGTRETDVRRWSKCPCCLFWQRLAVWTRRQGGGLRVFPNRPTEKSRARVGKAWGGRGNSFGLCFDPNLWAGNARCCGLFARIVSGGEVSAPCPTALSKKHLNLISALHNTFGFGVRRGLYSWSQ